MLGSNTLAPFGARIRVSLRKDAAELRRRLVQFSGVAGAIVALAALAVLIGWSASSLPLIHFFRSGWPTIQPNVAVGLLLCGASLFLLSDEQAGKRSRIAARLLAGAALVVGLVTMVEYLYGVDLWIDRVLFPGRLEGLHPGRIGPADAAVLVLASIGLLLMDTETRANRRPTEFMAVLVAAIALPTLVSFAFGALPSAQTRTSLFAAGAFCLLAAGLLFARPHRGFVAIVIGPGIGGAATRRLIPFFLVVPLVLGALFAALVHGDALGSRWIAPLFASAIIFVFAAVGFLATLSFHHSDVDRSRAERRLHAQNAATQALTESATVAEAIPTILSSFAESLNWDVGALWRVDPGQQVVRCVEMWHRPGFEIGAFEKRVRELAFQRGVGTPGRVWMTGDPAWVPDLPHFPSFRAVEAERLGLHAAFAFPIRYLNRVTGVIEFFSREVRQPDGEIVAMARVLGSQVGEAIERKYAEEELRASEDRFRAVAETARDALLFVDATGRVRYLNAAAERMFGVAAADLLGQSVAILLPHLPLNGEQRTDQMLETLARRADDGREFPVEISLAAWHSAGGAEFRTAIIRDITARKRAEEALRRARDEAETSNRELEAFGYSVSHDLRKPLRAIEGFSRALLEEFGEPLDERGRDYARRVASGAERMSLLMDDLLELSRAARINLRVQPVELSALAHEVANELHRRDPERKVELVIEDGLVAAGDESLLRAVLSNLLENAWKFTSRHEHARIEFGARREPDGRVVYFVRDDGAGFDPSYAQDLFRPFERLHKESEFPGTGVGLAIVQRIVRRHGGQVWADGRPDQGATFHFTLGGEAG
jgi:PAS domain S-box-containing protein